MTTDETVGLFDYRNAGSASDMLTAMAAAGIVLPEQEEAAKKAAAAPGYLLGLFVVQNRYTALLM